MRARGDVVSEFQLPRATLAGQTQGIVATEPLQIQCGICGLIETQPEGQGVALFIILSGSRFCTRDKTSIRRCRACVAEHAKECGRCAQ